MISTLQATIIILIIQIQVLGILLALSVHLIRENGKKLTAVFLSFCFALWLFTDLYWIIYDYMRPESRMPFAANEIGEAAAFLMMAATINSVFMHNMRPPILKAVGTLIFAVCNIALWIAWSGEWIQDILFGAVFAWFLYSVVRALSVESILKRGEWIALSVLCSLLIVCQVLSFALKENLKLLTGLVGYFLLIIGVIFFTYKLIREYRNADRSRAEISIAFALMAWIIMGKYMSDAGWYALFLALETTTLLLWYLTVRRVVRAT